MRYIVLDGVILDIDSVLFSKWRGSPSKDELDENEMIKYMKTRDWENTLYDACTIDNSIDILKDMDYKNSAIVTKVYSLSNNEVKAKVGYLKAKGIKQNIVIVPYYLPITAFIRPVSNILVDANLDNLYGWWFYGGEALFFDRFGNNRDINGKFNHDGYRRIRKINE